MPPQDSATLWKSLSPDQRQQALARMTPQQKTNLAGILGYQSGGNEASPTSQATPAQPTGVLRAPTDRERFMDPNFYPVGLKDEGIGENLKNLAQRGGVGIFQLADAAMNPGRTVRDLASSLLPDQVINWLNKSPDAKGRQIPTGTPNPLQQAYQALSTSRGPMEAAGKAAPLAGQALVTAGLGEAAPAIASDIADAMRAAAPYAKDAATYIPRKAGAGLRMGMQDLGGAGKEPVAKVIRQDAADTAEAQKKYTDALRAVQEKNTVTKSDYVNKEFSARQSEAQQSAVKAQTQTIERGQRIVSQRSMENAKITYKNVKEGLDQRWNKLRQILGERPINSENVANAVEEAKAKYLMGDPESLTIFNQLTTQLQRPTEFIDPGVPGQLKPTMKAMPWQQGRIFYTSLGDKMYGGGLPGNVFKALEHVQNALDKELNATARNAGPTVGKFYGSTKSDWAQFKKDWDDMSNVSYSDSATGEAGSPLARLVRAADPQTAARALANDRIMGQLARYRPQGMNLDLVKNFRALNTRLDGLDKVTLAKHPSKPSYEPAPTPPEITASKSPAQIRYEKLENYSSRPWRWFDLVPFNLFERTLLKSNDIRKWVATQPRREIPVEEQITK
jgi:hypothetical protein